MRPSGAVSLLVAALFGGCVDSSDPAAGGFYNGIAGIAGGGYERREAERESAVAEAQARNQALSAEQRALAARISATQGEVAQARFTLLRQRDSAPNLDARTRARVNAVLAAEPRGGTDAARLADLQRILRETRALSADLAQLAS
ncbi:hypothetical protein [Tropicimonas sp.]|uniref:hypothetical protein n=1 Tax=Tropicimonas sp. TaxID=2067044 RepID=UPI003A86BB4F